MRTSLRYRRACIHDRRVNVHASVCIGYRGMMGFVKARRTGKQDESNTGEALTLFSGGCRWPLRPTAFPQTVIPQPVLLPRVFAMARNKAVMTRLAQASNRAPLGLIQRVLGFRQLLQHALQVRRCIPSARLGLPLQLVFRRHQSLRKVGGQFQQEGLLART